MLHYQIQYLLTTLMGFFGKDSIKSQKGVTMVEYALVTALMASIVVAVLGTTFQNTLSNAFANIADYISDKVPQ